MRKSLQFLSLFVFVAILSCNKKDVEPTTPQDILVAKPWKLSDGFVADGIFIYPYDLQDCKQDDITIYRADMTCETNEGNSKCSVSAPQIFEQGKWSLEEDNKKLRVSYENGGQNVFTITEITPTSLKLTTMVALTVGFRTANLHYIPR